VRFTITPLGSTGGRTVAAVVDDIVRYLDKPRPAAKAAGIEDPEPGPSEYYADGSTEPGRWLGEGAKGLGLRGEVAREDFARVLAGRDPATGARLLTARGSAGRRPSLGVGTSTVISSEGELRYDERDAAAALRLEATELDALLSAGERTAVAVAMHALAGKASPTRDPSGSYLVPAVDVDGTRWIGESELRRCDDGRAEGPTADLVATAGHSDDLLPLAEAARLAGLTTRYLRGLAAKHERTVASGAAGTAAPARRHAQLVAYRGTRRQWLVRRSDLVDFLKRRTAPAVRVGYDLTLTTEKSLGVLALLGSAPVRTAVLGAIEAGNDAALRWLEERACSVRVNGEVMPAVGWAAASFRHLTSRALDPFPHHHNVVASGVETAGGSRRALDARGLYRHAVGASALATVEMRCRLTVGLGVQWRRSASEGWEIGGIPEAVLREFSRRQAEIDAAVAELEEAIGRTSTIEELRTVVATTRPPKEQADAADLLADWWGRAEALGFSAGDLAACVDIPQLSLSSEERDAQLFRHLAGPAGICARGSVFTRGELLAAMVDAPLLCGDDVVPFLCCATELETLADGFLASEAVVELRPPELPKRFRRLAGEPIYSTRDMLAVQQRIVDSFRHGLRHGVAAVLVDTTARALDGEPGLSVEQRALVRQFCGSGHRFQCAIGRAGSGKTTAMKAAAAAWRAGGYTVLGAAVKGEAARQLGAAAGVPAETVAWYLAREDPARNPLDSRSVLIVDEASTLSDRDLDRLMQLAVSTGAAIRFVGDPAQHGAVAAGGMFRVLCEEHPGLTPQLTSSRRLEHPADRAAAEALREGRIEEALKELQGAGHLHYAADDVNLYAKLLARWWDARASGKPHPLVERSNRRRRQLNRLAHRLLQVHGVIGPDVVRASGGRSFAVGDEVTARRGERSLHPPGEPHLYVRNGAPGRVVAAADDAIDVAFEDLGTITLPRSFFDEHRRAGGRMDVGLDHAYAVTSYAVQGATFELSTSRIDEHATRSETYVDITRGRQENHIYATRAEDLLDGERLPKAPAPPLDVSITMRLAASAGEVTAWELHQGHEVGADRTPESTPRLQAALEPPG
jgi:conjugative relaxase-like TrwC/TraI family protein